MSHVNQLPGQGPKGPNESGKQAPDPEKFKKVMEVKDTDADQQGRQKNLLQSEEDEGAQKSKDDTPDADTFSKIMDDRKKDSLFDGQSSSQQTTQTSDDLPPDGLLPNPPSYPSYQLNDLADDKDALRVESKNGIDPQQNEKPSSSSDTQETQEEDDGEKEPEKVEEAKTTPPLLPKSAPLIGKKEITAQKEAPSPTPSSTTIAKKPSKLPTPKKGEKEVETTTLETTQPTASLPTQKPTDRTSIEPEKKRSSVEHSLEGASKKPSILPVTKPSMVKEVVENDHPAQIIAPTPEGSTTTQTSSLSPPPSYTQLPPQLYELFEKMVGVMTVQQFQGTTTTTLQLSMPNSALNGAKIEISHYDTAPHAYNIQLLGNPSAVEEFEKNLPQLQAELQKNQPDFKINILKPALLTESTEEKKARLTKIQGTKGSS